MPEMLTEAGFGEVQIAGEGQINLLASEGHEITPFFKDAYYGETGVFEVLAQA